MSYELRYTPEAKKGLNEVFQAGLKHLAERTLIRIANNPFEGKKLTGELKGIFSSRITRRYRVLYTVSQPEKTVFILDVSHRREVYR